MGKVYFIDLDTLRKQWFTWPILSCTLRKLTHLTVYHSLRENKQPKYCAFSNNIFHVQQNPCVSFIWSFFFKGGDKSTIRRHKSNDFIILHVYSIIGWLFNNATWKERLQSANCYVKIRLGHKKYAHKEQQIVNKELAKLSMTLHDFP